MDIRHFSVSSFVLFLLARVDTKGHVSKLKDVALKVDRGKELPRRLSAEATELSWIVLESTNVPTRDTLAPRAVPV